MLENMAKLTNNLAATNCATGLKQPGLRIFKQSIFYHSYLFLDLQDLRQG